MKGNSSIYCCPHFSFSLLPFLIIFPSLYPLSSPTGRPSKDNELTSLFALSSMRSGHLLGSTLQPLIRRGAQPPETAWAMPPRPPRPSRVLEVFSTEESAVEGS